MLFVVSLPTDIELLGGLFQSTLSCQINDMLLSLIPFFQEGLLAAPVIVYSNAETDKLQIFTDNKGKTGIYLWTHKESGKIYTRSAVDLSRRFYSYYSLLELKRRDNYISRALIHHGYSAFSLSILEYIDISNLSLEEARKLIFSREQYYIDTLKPNYNIFLIAGSLLGFNHSEVTK
jgi:uncharacterized protein YqjF (DUF2071 family)